MVDELQDAYEVVVVGGGAAGLNGALMLGRSRRSVVVLDSGAPQSLAESISDTLVVVRPSVPDDLAELWKRFLASFRGQGVNLEMLEVRPKQNIILTKIPLDEMNTMDGIHLQKIKRKDQTLIPHPLNSDLRPPAWRCPEVDNNLATLKQFVLIVDFHQLKGSSRTPPFFLCHLDIRIINMLLHPRLAGSGSLHSLKCRF